jgi:hypothetical protein
MRAYFASAAKALLFFIATVLASFPIPTSANAATINWTLSSNIPLSDGGLLNGVFGVNDYGFTNGTFYDLQTSGGTTAFSQHYTTAINASNPNQLTVQFFAPDPSYSSSLTLVFANSLLDPSAINPIVGGIGGPSFECEGYSCTANNTRYVLAGYASSDGVAAATPLPAALPLFAGGAGMIGLFACGRKRKKTATV